MTGPEPARSAVPAPQEVPPAPAAPAKVPFPALPVTRRPDPALLTYYAVSSLALGPFFLFLLVPSYFKYRSLRYDVEEEGITMRWGVLFRREISLTYSRIQDIHLSSNFLERWLGLAKVQVQTASGSSSAEMTIEGLRDVDAVRDFLYGRMRGARDAGDASAGGSPTAERDSALAGLAVTLQQVAEEVRSIRIAMGVGGRRDKGDD